MRWTAKLKKRIWISAAAFATFVTVLTCSVVTFAKFSDSYVEKNGAQIAMPVIGYRRENLSRRGKNSTEEDAVEYTVDQNGETFEFSNLAPEDTLTYRFSISNYSGDKTSELPLKVKVEFSTHIYYPDVGGTSLTLQLDARQNTSDSNVNRSLVNLYAITENGESEVKQELVYDGALTDTDFNMDTMYVVTTASGVQHSVGFVFDAALKEENVFELQLKLPIQQNQVSQEEIANLRLNLRIYAEQIQFG